MALIKDTLYAKYIKERTGASIIEDESAFITYRIEGPECFIENMKVEKESLSTGKCREFFEKLVFLAVDSKCKFISANIDLNDRGASHTLLCALHLGFKVEDAQNKKLLIIKTLEVGNG